MIAVVSTADGSGGATLAVGGTVAAAVVVGGAVLVVVRGAVLAASLAFKAANRAVTSSSLGAGAAGSGG